MKLAKVVCEIDESRTICLSYEVVTLIKNMCNFIKSLGNEIINVRTDLTLLNTLSCTLKLVVKSGLFWSIFTVYQP